MNGNPLSPQQQQQHQQFLMMQQQQQQHAHLVPHPDQAFSYGRGRAWSGDAAMYGLPPAAPPPPPNVVTGYSSGGEGRPLMVGGGPSSSFDVTNNMSLGAPPPRHNGGHRRTDSNGSVGSVLSNMGGSIAGYGSISGGAPPSPRPTSASPRAAGADFSPRHEILNMMRPESPRTTIGTSTVPQSPRPAGGGGYAQASPRAAGMYNRQSTPPVQGGGSSYQSPYSPAHAAALAAAQAASGMDGSLLVGPSPTNSYQRGTSAGGGGEAVFVARSSGGSKAPPGSGESTHRRHMRQQSAQMYMEQVKGSPQPLMCRDLIFLLLFAFHLTGMVYLSNTYSKEALFPTAVSNDTVWYPEDAAAPVNQDVVHASSNLTSIGSNLTSIGSNLTVSDAMVGNGTANDWTTEEEDLDSPVTINYPHLLLVAICCGVFAMGISTTLLSVMTYFARRFIQVALVVIIALSFVWGTVGIGVSPKNVVPITGIIALALSVAYAILVWERIPFAASNLVTALSAIRAFPGTLVVALFFQALGCGWCIYYSVIVIGVYNSIQDGRIVLSERMAMVAYILLGISFYWTYQVLLVRSCDLSKHLFPK